MFICIFCYSAEEVENVQVRGHTWRKLSRHLFRSTLQIPQAPCLSFIGSEPRVSLTGVEEVHCFKNIQTIITPAVHLAILQTLFFFLCVLKPKPQIQHPGGTRCKCDDNIQPAGGRCGIILESREEQVICQTFHSSENFSRQVYFF